MKAGDLVVKRSYGRTWDNSSISMKVVTRVAFNDEPGLHGEPPYYVMLVDDPDKWHDPNDYYVVSEA